MRRITELVNCPDVTGYELVLDGVPVLPDSRCLTEFERKFNIHTGELVITSTYELESGASFCLTDRRFASMENEHLFVQSIGITMQKGCIKHGGICTGIDGQQTNSGVSHFKKVNCRVYDRKYLHVEGYLEEDTLSILEGVSYTGEEEEAVFTLKRRGFTGRYFFSIPMEEPGNLPNMSISKMKKTLLAWTGRRSCWKNAVRQGMQMSF